MGLPSESLCLIREAGQAGQSSARSNCWAHHFGHRCPESSSLPVKKPRAAHASG